MVRFEMRDRLGKSAWDNLPISNPTQNRYSRFMKMPHGEIKTAFTDSIEWFKNFQKETDTVYERLIGEL